MRHMFAISILVSILTSCAMNTGTGVLSGAVLGAGAGSLWDNGRGALIGTAIGALSGGLVGVILDDQDRRIMERSSPRTVDRMDRSEPLTINDIIKLSQNGIPDQTIMDYVTDTQSTYHLSQSQIRRLKEAGVSQRIINFMIAAN